MNKGQLGSFVKEFAMLEAVRRKSTSPMRRTVLFASLAILAMSAGAKAQVGVPVVPDSDADGIDDILEEVLDTDPFGEDSDGDGWNDGIELSRRSDPLVAANIPGGTVGQLSVGFWSRTARLAGYVRSFSFVFLPDGYPAAGLQMQIVVLQPDLTLLVLGEAYLSSPQARRRIDFLPVPNDDAALLMVVGVNLTDEVIAVQGQMSAAVVVWHGAPSAPEAAERDRSAIDGRWLQHQPGTPILYSRPVLEPSAGTVQSTIYQPINPAHEPPPDWTADSICRQRTAPVGTGNGLVIYRVVAASCDDGWDAHCSPVDCAATAGDEFSAVDPVAFLGG
jgi:hypothetical protein